MRDPEYSRKQVVKYLLWTFGLAYLIQFGAAFICERNLLAGQLVIAAMMFVPALGALLAGADLKSMGWKPRIRRKVSLKNRLQSFRSSGDAAAMTRRRSLSISPAKVLWPAPEKCTSS